MSKFEFVMRRLESGAKIRILQDVYGQEKIEVHRSWLPLVKRLSLSRNETNQVKMALSARSKLSKLSQQSNSKWS